MTIDFKGIPQSLLAEAFVRAGVGFVQVDDVLTPVPSEAAVQAIIDAYTVADAIRQRQAESLAIAKALRDRVVASISPGEMASWPIKRAEAIAYAGSGDPAHAPMLSAEAAARGITLQAMLAKVQSNATAFASLEAAIGGADGRHRDALAALQTFESVASYDVTTGWPEV